MDLGPGTECDRTWCVEYYGRAVMPVHRQRRRSGHMVDVFYRYYNKSFYRETDGVWYVTEPSHDNTLRWAPSMHSNYTSLGRTRLSSRLELLLNGVPP